MSTNQVIAAGVGIVVGYATDSWKTGFQAYSATSLALSVVNPGELKGPRLEGLTTAPLIVCAQQGVMT